MGKRKARTTTMGGSEGGRGGEGREGRKKAGGKGGKARATTMEGGECAPKTCCSTKLSLYGAVVVRSLSALPPPPRGHVCVCACVSGSGSGSGSGVILACQCHPDK